MITCGVDIGARSIEVVLYDGAQILETLVADTGTTPTTTAEAALGKVLETAGMARADVASIAATGYGRNYFEPADRSVSEILCHARGANYYFPGAGTVIDIGGQDSKLIELGEGGRPLDFVMNDRCAAGTGRFIELTGMVLGVPVGDMNRLVSPGDGKVEISSMCAVFAESEIVGLLQRGCSVQTILNGVFSAVARRTTSMAGRAKVKPDIVFTGGVARIDGVRAALEAELGSPVQVPPNPRITGALGAAILASPARPGFNLLNL